MTLMAYANGIKVDLSEDANPVDPNLEHLIEKGTIAARINRNRILEKADRNRILEIRAGTKEYTKKEIEEENKISQIKAETNSAKTDIETQLTDLYSSETNQDQQIELYTEEAKDYLSGLKLRLNDQVKYDFIVNSLANPENSYDDSKVLMLKQLDKRFSDDYNPVELSYAISEAKDLEKVEYMIWLNKQVGNEPLVVTIDNFMSDIVPDEDIVPSREPTSDKKSIEHYRNTERQDDKKVNHPAISEQNAPVVISVYLTEGIEGILPANLIEMEKHLNKAGMHIEKGPN